MLQTQTVRRSPVPRATVAVRLDFGVYERIAELAERNGVRLSIQARELLTAAVKADSQEPQTEVQG